MWVYLSEAMFSIVQDRTYPDKLIVRSRRRGDIEKVFPDATIAYGKGTDYPYRAWLPREVVAEAIKAEVEKISYPNFKGSVKDPERHDVYSQVWYQTLKLENELHDFYILKGH